MFEVRDLLHRVIPPAERVAARETHRVIHLGDLTLDTERLVVTESGQLVTLTPREVMLLRYLLDRVSRVVTRQQLLSDVWSYHYTGDDRTVDVHISRLRSKIDKGFARPLLHTVRGAGYMIRDGAR